MPLELPPEEAARLRAGEGPAGSVEMIAAMTFHAVVAALRLGVFRALAAGPRTAGALAAELGVHEENLDALLRVLVTGGYLAHEPGGYTRTPAGTWLEGADTGYGAVLDFWHTLLGELWSGLEESVRTGVPRRDFYRWLEEHPETAARFQGLQRGLAEWLGEEMLEKVTLPDDASSLLDLGGGHALYSIAYCRRHPDLRATVADLPTALESGRKAAAEAGLNDRIGFLAGDIVTADLPTGQDAVLLLNVLHTFPADVARTVVGRAAAALRPKGRLIVMENLPDPVGGVLSTAFMRCFDLNLRHTQGGMLHPVERIAEWMTEAGCTPPERIVVTRSGEHVLLVADRDG